MTFGWNQASSPVDNAIASQMVNSFVHFHNADVTPSVHIDTARIYAGGVSEEMLGSALGDLKEGPTFPYFLSVGTKAHPSQPNGLSPQGLRDQLKASFDAMGVSSVDEYYLHQPDDNNSLLESLRTLNGMVQDGLISTVGMSNYHVSEVQRAFDLCREHGLTKPAVYQGLYNPLNRLVEQELLPVLKENGCRFVAYNPLAAGLLTGKHSNKSSDVKDGRFKDNPNYMPRFYTSGNFEAVGVIQYACEASNISMVEASYRWLLRHSALSPDDGVLIGASSRAQLDENLQCCACANDVTKDELPQSVVAAFDEAWDLICKDKPSGPFPYWRSYSSDMPGRSQLDPGASYNANKAK